MQEQNTEFPRTVGDHIPCGHVLVMRGMVATARLNNRLRDATIIGAAHAIRWARENRPAIERLQRLANRR